MAKSPNGWKRYRMNNTASNRQQIFRNRLAILTNGKVTGDKVGPHIDLLDEFPYLGPPHA
jgi:hypothetical protein